MQPETSYPVRFTVDYPDRELNRLTTFFRLFMAIPILFVLSTVAASTWQSGGGQWRNGQWENGDQTMVTIAGVGGLLFFAPLLMIVFRQKYPRWWFDWNLELQRFSNRVVAYLALLDDQYPSTDEQQSVHLTYEYPDVPRELNRVMPLIKWLLAIPHFVILIVLGIVAFFVVIFAWFAILFTGRYPRGLFDYVVGVIRWQNRVVGYAITLVTDKYPPFSLQP